MSKPPVVSIVSPGAMGASIGELLTQNGIHVKTLLEGRSKKSKDRAAAAKMTAVSVEEIGDCDFLLSIVPPAEALAVADDLIDGGAFQNHAPVYVDCNAIAPDMTKAIGDKIKAAGCAYIDAGIVGGAAKPNGERQPCFYASGEDASSLTALSDYGLDIRPLDAPIGAASALKMALAGVAKGMTGFAVLMALVADKAGVKDAFENQLRTSQPAFYSWAQKRLPTVGDKAYRWVSEMQTLSEIAGDYPGGASLYQGLAELYDWIGEKDQSAEESIKVFSNAFKL